MLSRELLIACVLFSLGHVLAWFQLNSQYIWDWWRDHPVTTVAIYSFPCGLLFYFGWRHATVAMESVWSARLITFGISFLVFPILTWYLLGESMFKPKTLVCVALSLLIILIQVFWKS